MTGHRPRILLRSRRPGSGSATRSTKRRLLAALALLAGLLGAALAAAPAASAHATVVTSDPVDGARLATAPATVSVTFDEPVSLAGIGYLHVVDQQARRVDSGAATHPGGDGTKISVALRPGLGDGTYTASFRVISADSHPVAGSIRFVVGDGALGAAPTNPSTVNRTTSAAYDVVRWVGFAGLALLGGGWLLLTVWPAGRDDRTARWLAWTGWWAAVAGALAELLLQGPYAAGDGLGALGRWSLLDDTLHTTFGTAHSVRLLLLGALGGTLILLLRDLRRSRLAETAGALTVGVILTYAVSGHAGAQNPRWLALASDCLHLAAMSAWIGGLAYVALAVLPRRDPDELRAVLPVFSRVAFGSVVVVAGTGVIQSWLGVGSWGAFVDSRYGQLVLAKIGLFTGLLVLGNLSRVAIERRYVRPVAYAMTAATVAEPAPPGGVGRMRRAVLAELGIGAVVLGVTAVLVAEPPGRAVTEAAAAAAQQSVVQLGGGRTVTVRVEPGRHGPVTVTLRFSAGPAPSAVTVTASLPARQLGPIAVPVRAVGAGTYRAADVLLPAAGRWEIDLDVRTSEFDSTTANTHLRLH